MGLIDLFRRKNNRSVASEPQNATVITTLSLTDPNLAAFLKGDGFSSSSGEPITPQTALKVAVVYRCVNIITGAVGSLPMDLKRRIDANTREDASDHALWPVLKRRPNAWQTPHEFKKLLQTCVLLRGNGYALIQRSRGEVKALYPLVGQMEVTQGDDLALKYTYTRKNGTQIVIPQRDILHLRGMSLDGVTGLSVLGYARESLGLSLTTTRHAGKLFKNRTSVGGTLSTPQKVDDTQIARLKSRLEEFRSADGDDVYKDLILEDGMKYDKVGMSSVDAQFIQTREMTAFELAMFFGVPPHMLGLTTKTTSWGSGIEQQSLGFVAYTLQDHLTMWGESIGRDLLTDSDIDIYARINPSGLIRGDIKTRYWAYATGRQWGWLSANDVRAKEDDNPIGDEGNIYLQPSNMIDAGAPPPDQTAQDGNSAGN